MHFPPLFSLVTLPLLSPLAACVPNIKTTSGILQGTKDLSFLSVNAYLGIPYSHPPTGPRRFLPPSPLVSPSSVINATSIGPACPQHHSQDQAIPDVYSSNGGNQTEFFPPADGPFSEDCLTLNVWTPATPNPRTNKTEEHRLPVLVWFFGGGFTRGGTNSPYYNPSPWIQRSQSHIVVAVNFRSNIFGFPNSALLPLDAQNLGLLDQRLALEWVRDNIEHFGGDAKKIVGWGHSAGAIALDYLNFAYREDLILAGVILSSGTAFYPSIASQSSDTLQRNFSAVAEALGCVGPEAQIECLRNVPWQDITSTVSDLRESSPQLNFLPVVDNRLVFANYTQRYARGLISPIPALIGTNQHEINAIVPRPNATAPDSYSDAATNATFLCTAEQTSQLRTSRLNLTTYRYLYAGDFPNISPEEYPSAYHAAELPLIFGTAGLFHGESTKYEEKVSRGLQDLWVTFAEDPERGLRGRDWGTYGEGRAAILGEGGEVGNTRDRGVVRMIDGEQLNGVCGLY